MRTRRRPPILDVEYTVISEGRRERRRSRAAAVEPASALAPFIEYTLYAIALAIIPAVVRALTSR